MRKIIRAKDVHQQYGAVSLYLDDYFGIVEILEREGIKLKVTVDDFELDTPEEIRQLSQPIAEEVEIRSLRPWDLRGRRGKVDSTESTGLSDDESLSISIRRGSSTVIASISSAKARGLYSEISQRLKGRRRFTRFLNPFGVVLVAPVGLFAFSPGLRLIGWTPSRQLIGVGLALLGLTMICSIVGVTLAYYDEDGPVFGPLRQICPAALILKNRSDVPGFWHRNWEVILVDVLKGAFKIGGGAALGYLAARIAG